MLTLLIVFISVCIAGVIFSLRSKKQINSLVDVIDDKQAIINALQSHVVESVQTPQTPQTPQTKSTTSKKSGESKRKSSKKKEIIVSDAVDNTVQKERKTRKRN